jgi:hypothetical protein
MATRTPKPKRRHERGDDGISWDKVNKCYVGTVSLGYRDSAKRVRRTVRGKTKQEVKGKLDKLHDEIKAGIHTPATYTVKQCVMDWLDSLELDPHTMATYRGQAEKWIYLKIGAKKLAEFKATDAERFLRDVAKVLSKASLVKIKSTLVRSIRRAQKYDLIGRNVAALVDQVFEPRAVSLQPVDLPRGHRPAADQVPASLQIAIVCSRGRNGSPRRIAPFIRRGGRNMDSAG